MPSTKSKPRRTSLDCHLNNQRLINSLGAEVNESVGLMREKRLRLPHRTEFLLFSGEAFLAHPDPPVGSMSTRHCTLTALRLRCNEVRHVCPRGGQGVGGPAGSDPSTHGGPPVSRHNHARAIPEEACVRRECQLYNAPNCTANPAHEGPRRCQPITPAVCLEMQGPRYPALAGMPNRRGKGERPSRRGPCRALPGAP